VPSSSLVLQPITGLDRPNYAFPLASLLCLISPSLDAKNSQFLVPKPPIDSVCRSKVVPLHAMEALEGEEV
jgi:hypothetical protein